MQPRTSREHEGGTTLSIERLSNDWSEQNEREQEIGFGLLGIRRRTEPARLGIADSSLVGGPSRSPSSPMRFSRASRVMATQRRLPGLWLRLPSRRGGSACGDRRQLECTIIASTRQDWVSRAPSRAARAGRARLDGSARSGGCVLVARLIAGKGSSCRWRPTTSIPTDSTRARAGREVRSEGIQGRCGALHGWTSAILAAARRHVGARTVAGRHRPAARCGMWTRRPGTRAGQALRSGGGARSRSRHVHEGQRRFPEAGLDNVRWVLGTAEDLPMLGVGPFRVATFGQSFHRVRRLEVTEIVYDLLEPGGSLVLISNEVDGRPRPDGPEYPSIPHDSARDLIVSYLGEGTRHYLATWNEGQPARFEEALVRTRFGRSERSMHPDVPTWSGISTPWWPTSSRCPIAHRACWDTEGSARPTTPPTARAFPFWPLLGLARRYRVRHRDASLTPWSTRRS